jgi:hypothetical protein
MAKTALVSETLPDSVELEVSRKMRVLAMRLTDSWLAVLMVALSETASVLAYVVPAPPNWALVKTVFGGLAPVDPGDRLYWVSKVPVTPACSWAKPRYVESSTAAVQPSGYCTVMDTSQKSSRSADRFVGDTFVLYWEKVTVAVLPSADTLVLNDPAGQPGPDGETEVMCTTPVCLTSMAGAARTNAEARSMRVIQGHILTRRYGKVAKMNFCLG